jgi:hypothetical protein
MLKLKPLITICLFISFIGCRKEETVVGTVKEYNTNIPIANAQVSIHFAGHRKFHYRSTTTTDGSGNFNFNFKHSDLVDIDNKAFVDCESNGYWNFGWGIGSYFDVNAPIEITLIPVTAIKCHLKKISLSNQYITIYPDYNKVEGFQYGAGFLFPDTYSFSGTNIDTTVFLNAAGNSYPTKITWGLADSANQQYYSAMHDTTIYCPGKDTAFVLINF